MKFTFDLENMLDTTANTQIVEELAGKNRMSVRDFCERNGLKRYRVTKRSRFISERGAGHSDFQFELYAPSETWIRQHHNSRNGLPVVKIESLPF